MLGGSTIMVNLELAHGWSASENTPQLVDLGIGKTVSVSSAQDMTTHVQFSMMSFTKCWGSPGNGELLGTGATSIQPTPQLVNLGPGKTAVSVSAGISHTCAILNDGNMKCWGSNNAGQLGIGSTINQPFSAASKSWNKSFCSSSRCWFRLSYMCSS